MNSTTAAATFTGSRSKERAADALTTTDHAPLTNGARAIGQPEGGDWLSRRREPVLPPEAFTCHRGARPMVLERLGKLVDDAGR